MVGPFESPRLNQELWIHNPFPPFSGVFPFGQEQVLENWLRHNEDGDLVDPRNVSD